MKLYWRRNRSARATVERILITLRTSFFEEFSTVRCLGRYLVHVLCLSAVLFFTIFSLSKEVSSLHYAHDSRFLIGRDRIIIVTKQ